MVGKSGNRLVYINSVYNIVGQLAVMLAGVIAAKFIFSDLGGSELGVVYFGLFLQLALTELVTLGIAPSITREIAKSENIRGGYIKHLLQCSSFILWVLYCLVCCGTYFFIPWIVDGWLNLGELDSNSVVDTLRVLIIGSLLSIPCVSFVASLEGIQKMIYPNLVNAGVAITKNVGILVILVSGGDLMSVVCWISVSAILRTLALLGCVARFFSWSFFVPRFHLHVLQKTWKYGLRMSSISIAAFINVQVEKVVITNFLAVAILGYYSLVLSIVQGLTIIAGSLSRAAYPVFVCLFNDDLHDEINDKYDLWQDLICFLSVPFIALLIFFNQILFGFIFDDIVSAQIEGLVYWLCLGVFFQIACFLPYFLAISCGQEKMVIRLGWYNVVITSLGAYFGIKFFGLGGAGLGYVAARIMVIFYSIPKITQRILNQSWVLWAKKLLQIVFVSCLSFGLLFILNQAEDFDFIGVLLCYIVALLLYFVFGWFLATQSFRDFFKNVYLGVRVVI